MSTGTTRWTVGRATITSVVEDEVAHIPPELFFPEASAAAVAAHDWVLEHWADADGNVALRVQALVVETGTRRVLVDPCVGNGKTQALPFWHDQQWPFLDRFGDAGFDVADVDTVVHTHLHADHVGWDTHRRGDEWVPTFTSARHLYTADALAWARANADAPMQAGTFRESIAPILDAGLADEVAPDADLGDGLRLEPSPGHTPGHVSLWVESDGARALVTGDFVHHPVQCAEPGWSEVGDDDADLARTTRRRMLASVADADVLVVGTHFPTRSAGHVVTAGDAWRFVAV
jgi:glyoxylase-like metal-dependent hydrolase (beta-lactamase superfamily II)